MPPKRKAKSKKRTTKRRSKKTKSTFRNKKKTVSKGEKHRFEHAIHAQKLNTISRGQYVEGIRQPFVGRGTRDVVRDELYPMTAAGLAGWGPANPDQSSAAFERKQKRDLADRKAVEEYPDQVKIPPRMKLPGYPKRTKYSTWNEYGELESFSGQPVEEFKDSDGFGFSDAPTTAETEVDRPGWDDWNILETTAPQPNGTEPDWTFPMED
jgi:hypothetical protein